MVLSHISVPHPRANTMTRCQHEQKRSMAPIHGPEPVQHLPIWASSSDPGNGAQLWRPLRVASRVEILQVHDLPGHVVGDGVHATEPHEGTSKPHNSRQMVNGFFSRKGWNKTVNDTHSGAKLSPQQTNWPSQFKAVLTIQRISPWGRPTSWQKICRKTRTTCASTVSSKRRTRNRATVGVGPSPHSCKVAHEVGFSAPSASGFDANEPPSGSVRQPGVRGTCGPHLHVCVRRQRRPWWLPQRKAIHGL